MKKLKLIVICFVIAAGITGCSKNVVFQSTALHVAHQMVLDIDSQDFAMFKQLFTDGRRDVVQKTDFENMKSMTTAEASYSNYELVKFSNGNMLLVLLKPSGNGGDVSIQDVIAVPDDMKSLFTGK